MIIAAKEDSRRVLSVAEGLRANGHLVVTHFDGSVQKQCATPEQDLGIAISEADVVLRIDSSSTPRSTWVNGEVALAVREDVPVIDVPETASVTELEKCVCGVKKRDASWMQSPSTGQVYEQLVPPTVKRDPDSADEALAQTLAFGPWARVFDDAVWKVDGRQLNASEVLDDLERNAQDYREKNRVKCQSPPPWGQ